jgi:hypothetical protein
MSADSKKQTLRILQVHALAKLAGTTFIAISINQFSDYRSAPVRAMTASAKTCPEKNSASAFASAVPGSSPLRLAVRNRLRKV